MAKKIRITEDDGTNITLLCDCKHKTTIKKSDLKVIEKTKHVDADSKADPPVVEQPATYYENMKQHDCENPDCDAIVFIEV